MLRRSLLNRRFSTKLQDFNVLSPSKDLKRIQSLFPNGFKIENEKIKGPIIILNNEIYKWNVPQYGVGGPDGDVEPIKPNSIQDKSSPFYGWDTDMLYLFEHTDQPPELLIIGSGQTMTYFPTQLRDYMQSIGVATEIMNSKSAANTFNVLLEDGRKVAIAALPLIPTDSDGKTLVETESYNDS